MNKLIEQWANLGIVGLVVATLLSMLMIKPIREIFIKAVKTLIVQQGGRYTLRKHPIFNSMFRATMKINNIVLDKPINTMLFKNFLLCMVKVTITNSKVFIKEYKNYSKSTLSDGVIKLVYDIKNEYKDAFISSLMVKYGSKENFKKLIKLLDCSDKDCIGCTKCDFIKTDLTVSMIEYRITKVAEYIIDSFEKYQTPDIDVMLDSISDINNAYKSNKDRVDDVLNELYRTYSVAIRITIIVFKNFNGHIANTLKGNQ